MDGARAAAQLKAYLTAHPVEPALLSRLVELGRRLAAEDGSRSSAQELQAAARLLGTPAGAQPGQAPAARPAQPGLTLLELLRQRSGGSR